MDLNKRLKELKPQHLNCNVFDVYSYNGLTMQDLLCQFFTKINECVTSTNEVLDLTEWLVSVGLEEEVVKKLMGLIKDGTIEKLINVNLFNTLTSQLEQKAEKIYVDTKIGNMGNTKIFKGSCLYSALPTTNNNVDDYWYVTDKNTNYCWNGTAWVDIGNNLNLGDKTITPSKTTFVEEIPYVNKLKTTEKEVVGNSLFIPIYLEPNKTYHVQHSVGFSGCFIGILDNTRTNTLITIVNWTIFNGQGGANFTTDNTIAKGWYMFRFQIPRDIDSESNADELKNNWLVCEGTTTIKYVDYEPNLVLDNTTKIVTENFNDNSIDSNILKDYGIQNITFNFNDGITIDELTGTTAPGNNIRKGDKIFKKVYPNTRYYVNFPCRIMFYNSNEQYISWVNKDDLEITGRFFDTPSNCENVRINVPYDFENVNTIFIMSDEYVTLENANKEVFDPYKILKKGKKSVFEGKKMVTDGHSIVAQGLWQNYLIRELGVKLHKNCGVGGTTIKSMCSDERVEQIPTDTEVLLLMAETNDFSQNIELGNLNSPHDDTTFYGAYQLWLDKIYAKIPNATVIIIGSPYKVNEDIVNAKGLTLNDYRNATKEIAFKYGYKYIDLRGRMKVNYLNYETFIPDGAHPGMYGAKNMADIIVEDIKNMSSIDYTIKYN